MNSRELIINLLEKHPEDLLQWVKLAMSQRVDLPEDFSWSSLSSGIILRIKHLISDGNFEDATVWFNVLDDIYGNAINGRINRSEMFFLQDAIMLVRAAFIRKFGASEVDPLLDEDILVTWFFDNLNVPLDTAIRKSEDWQNVKQQKKVQWLREGEGKVNGTGQTITVEDLKRLRKIKNKLSILEPLYQNKLIENKELGDWISIMHKLP